MTKKSKYGIERYKPHMDWGHLPGQLPRSKRKRKRKRSHSVWTCSGGLPSLGKRR
jgi:hypothetical protein